MFHAETGAMEQERSQTSVRIDHTGSKHQSSSKHSEMSTTDSNQATTKDRAPTLQHNPETQANRFFPFIELPPELRTIVYHFAFSWLILSTSSLGDAGLFAARKQITTFEPLALLQLCKEVRVEVKPEYLRFLRKKEVEIEESKSQAWEEWNHTLKLQAEEVETMVAGGDDQERAEYCVEMRWTPEREARDGKSKVAEDAKDVVGILIDRSERRNAQKSSEEQVATRRGSCR